MTTVNDVFRRLCAWAPLELQMDFDNSGFQIGRGDVEVSRILLALDITDDVVSEAEELGAQLIVTHHPLLFHPPRTLTDGDPETARILRLAERHLAVISMHTNLDIAQGGVNDVLIRLLGAQPECALDADGCGRVGCLPEPMELPDFLKLCRNRLRVNGLRYVSGGRPVRRLAVMGGAGADSMDAAWQKGCDTYVTADIKYHQFLRAKDLDMNLIDADHFCTENPVIFNLRDRLQQEFPDLRIEVSQRHGPVIAFA